MVGLDTSRSNARIGRGFPTDLPMVGRPVRSEARIPGRGFPTDLPMVGLDQIGQADRRRRGFPTDLPMVGHLGIAVASADAVVSLPICPW